jgi:hypothetical protein
MCKLGLHVWKPIWHLKYDQCPYCRKIRYWEGYHPMYPKWFRDALDKNRRINGF